MTTITAPYEDATAVFRKACDSFRENLPAIQQGEFTKYKDAQSMISAIQALAENHPVHRTKLTEAVRKLHRFSSKLEPYFDIVSIFVQMSPEYAGLVWGSLRMIFQLSSNYVTFLDKICDMFVSISTTLPAYEEYVNVLQSRAQNQGHSHPRLAKALSFVYVDILRFCHNTCLLFSRKRKEMKLRESFIGRLVWMPISVQFSDVLSTLKEHKELLDLEISRASTEESLRFYAVLEEKMRDAELLYNTPARMSDLQKARIEEIDKEARGLQEWINPPRWADSFEQAQNRRTAGTCDWILNDPKFQKWQSEVCNPNSTLGGRTLSIQAKPGFGKTVLCATMIDHLGQCVLSSENTAEELSASVFFYFFDKRRGNSNSSADAMRAVLAQLIYLHRHNKKVMRTATVHHGKSATGQPTATDNETMSVLTSLLQLLDITFLVFDGLDECSDYPLLFERIDEAASESRSCAVLLSSRPSVQLPKRLSKDCLTMQLTLLENTDDIKHYLLPEIEELVDLGSLPSHQSAEEIVGLILPRANGMFLWVRLLVKYLGLPVLTLRERQDAILNLNRLEGLDALYNAILDSLESQFPRRSQPIIRRIFQWVAYAQRPLHIDELRVAISIPLNRPQSMDDEIPNFREALGTLTGSLIELTPDLSAQFIHLSAHEFFTGAGESSVELGTPTSKAALYLIGANRDMASACVSYLYYSIPAEPLGGSSQITPNAGSTKHKYRFLRYSAAFWSDHFAYSLEDIGVSETDSSQNNYWKLLADLVITFISDKYRITMWIEASWLFDSPRIQDLQGNARMTFSSSISTDPSLVALAKAMESVCKLSKDVTTLNREWSHVLQLEPNEIWEPSIPAFTKSQFWVDTSAARLIRLAPLKEDSAKCITVQSQISNSGSEIGVVRLIPPSEWIDENSWESSRNLDWKARYELWSLRPSRNVCSVEIILPARKIRPLLDFPKTREGEAAPFSESVEEAFSRLLKGEVKERTVSLPVTISNDLCRAIILDAVVEISFPRSSLNLMSPESTTLRSQILDVTTRSNFTPFRTDINFEYQTYERLFHIKFSPSGKYLVLIRESIRKAWKEDMVYGQLWWMQVFRDENFESSSGPNYVCIGLSTFFSVPEITLLGPCRGVAFHPTLPRLAFPQVCDGMPQTYIWDFEETATRATAPNFRSNPFPVHEPPVIDSYFTDDGVYLCGTLTPFEFGFSSAILQELCVPVIARIPDYVPVAASILDSKVPSKIQTNPLQIKGISLQAAFDLAKRPKPHVQRANSLVFERGARGVVHVSQLQQLEKQGTVMLRTFGADGKFHADTFTRLPDAVRKCVDVSLVHSTTGGIGWKKTKASDDVVYVVLNKSHQKEYTPSDIENKVLPAVIERKKESIPSFINTVPMLPGQSRGFESYYGVQRLEWRE